MPRQIAGSLRQRARLWEVTFDSARFRARETFTDEATAQRWRAAVIAAVTAGQPAPDADLYRRPLTRTTVQRELTEAQRARTPLQVGFDSFLRVRYDIRRSGNPERAATAQSFWDNHIEPFLISAIDAPDGACFQDIHAEIATAFACHLAGRGSGEVADAVVEEPDLWLEGGQEMTAREAAAQADVSIGKINQLRNDGKLVASEASDGTWRYTHQALRDAGLLGGGPLPTGLSRRYAGEILTILRMTMEHVRRHGATGVPNIAGELKAIEPHKADRLNAVQADSPFATWQETRHVAGHLHVIWQLGLWMLRTLGLRIGEVFGPRVGDVVDLGDCGFLVISRQGGRPFLTRDDYGNTIITATKDPKSPQSVRILPLPVALLELIRIVIAALHTDPDTGVINLEARLLPTLRSDHGGQSGLRQALTKAARSVGLLNVKFNPHSHRAALVTDLHELTDIDGWVVRRLFGHLPGTDVHAKHYQKDHPLMGKLKAAVAHIDAIIAAELGGSLLVPTSAEPLFAGSGEAARRWPHSRSVLRQAGCMTDPLMDEDDPLLDAQQGADVLRLSPQVLRRALASGVVPSERRRVNGKWQYFVRLSVVATERERRDGLEQLPDLCAELKMDYDVAKRLLAKQGHHLALDRITGWYVLPPDAAQALRDEASRTAALHERSVRINEASTIIGCGLTQGRKMLRDKILVLDGESDYAGRIYVTRASVEVARELWETKHRPRVARGAWLDITVAANALSMTVDQLELVAELSLLSVRMSHRRKQLRRDELLAFAEQHRPGAMPALRTAV